MKILIVRLSSIGDAVQGIPCLVALKESFPDWKISWLVEETSAPILKNHPYLEHLFILRRDWRKKKEGVSPLDVVEGTSNMWKVWRALRREHFDAAIDFQGLFKSGFWSWLSGAPRRIGHNKTREFAHYFLNEFASDRPTFDPSFPLVERYLEPARLLGADLTKAHYILPPSDTETTLQVNSLFNSVKVHTKNNGPFVALCPWSAWPSKNWPLERWKELARCLLKDFHVLIIGTSSNEAAAHEICLDAPDIINFAGKTNLAMLTEIFKRCKAVIGPDSGPVHLANATGIPHILMLFGPTSWKRSGPFGHGHRTLSTNLECQPCFKRICPLGHLNCQKQLSLSDVLEAAQELAKSKR